MARRSFQHQPEAIRRRALIDATLDAVADVGLAGATVREVAKRASVTPGLIRRYFQNKDRLVEAAYATFVDELTTELRRQAGDGSPLERLERLVVASCCAPIASQRQLSIWAAFIGVAHVNEAMAQVHREGYRSFRRLLEDMIRALQCERGALLDPVSISRQAIAVNALIDGIWLEVSLERRAFDDFDIEALTLKSVLAILQPVPQSGEPA